MLWILIDVVYILCICVIAYYFGIVYALAILVVPVIVCGIMKFLINEFLQRRRNQKNNNYNKIY
jgi:hypothetical protein